MAVYTGSSDNQAALEQSFAVNGHGIIGDNIMLGNVMPPCYIAIFPVTLTAGCGYIHDIAGGAGIFGVVYFMLSMAVDAHGSVGIAAGQGLAVEAV
jgi:hypothetical protein